ncbi:MAG: NAD(P)H-binding protein [Coriobacteriia bacterium]|nr:NAD(P)H-binding protein [Coriobacteriia bacterium]
MKLIVFGATGRTGRHVVEKALGHGHAVTAFTHSTPLAVSHANLSAVSGDARDFESVSAAVAGHTAVAFALSGAGNHEPAMANVIHAMAEHDVRRLSAVSAAGTFARNDKSLPLAYRALVATALRSAYDDLERMEQRIMASDLDWAIIRPVGLTDDPATGDYRVSLDGSLLSRSSRISREDVAGLVIKSLETDTYLRRSVVIAQ